MIDNESLQNLEKLNQLKNDGVISEAEFERSKERLLFGGGHQRAKAASSPMGNPAPDDHFGWMTLPLKRYAQFDGRASRKEFWMFQLFHAALLLVGIVLIGATRDEYGDPSGFGLAITGLIVLGLLGLFVPLLAVEARRFHDQDRSGWFALLNLIPYVGPLVVLAFMLIEGTHGDNRSGSDPR